MTNSNESTYALIVRSEEKSRSAIELIVYGLCILSAVVSIWQFAKEPVRLSAPGLAPCVACATTPVEKAHI